MKSYVPLKTAHQEDEFIVGHKATLFSHLEKEMSVPFSLVITSDIFFEFISHNALGDMLSEYVQIPHDTAKQVEIFADVAKQFTNASFAPNVLKELRECFELVCLDTNNLSDLSKSPQSQILQLTRSTNYEDKDDICGGRVWTKNDFDSFIEAIKSTYISAFSPSSIQFRQKKDITEFSIAIIVTKVPASQSCLEIEYDQEKENIQIQSYVGFIDTSNIVEKDKFLVGREFLKVQESSISKQNMVSVFDIHHNKPTTKQYMTMGSTQSVADPTIVEGARLAKKVHGMTNHEQFYIEFLADRHNNLQLTMLTLHPAPNTVQETLLKQTTQDSNSAKITKNEEITSDDELQAIVSRNQTKEEKSEISMDIFSPQTQTLARALKEFLSINQHKSLKRECEIMVRALEHQTSKETLSQALVLAKQIISNWEK